jgi:hypothetical protein
MCLGARPFCLPQEVLPQRGHGLRPPIKASVSQGSKMAMMDPSHGPQKRLLCRGKSVGSAIRVLWCPGWTRLAFGVADATSTATTGHGLRD